VVPYLVLLIFIFIVLPSDKPEFQPLASPIEFTEGQPYVLNISASGNPADLEYLWLTSGGEPLGSLGGAGVSLQGGVMTVARATRELAGTYVLFANNSEGSATLKFQIDILFAPRYFFSYPAPCNRAQL
jgi:hypothetical protein